MFKDKLILYTDASIKKGEKSAFFGGHLTNESGVILYVFFDKIVRDREFSEGEINFVETVAINEGINVAFEMGASDLVVKTDSMHSVRCIEKGIFMPSSSNKIQKKIDSYSVMVNSIVDKATSLFDKFDICHLPRDKNYFADAIAEYGRKREAYSGIKTKNRKQEYKLYLKDFKRVLNGDVPYDFTEERRDHERSLQKLKK